MFNYKEVQQFAYSKWLKELREILYISIFSIEAFETTLPFINKFDRPAVNEVAKITVPIHIPSRIVFKGSFFGDLSVYVYVYFFLFNKIVSLSNLIAFFIWSIIVFRYLYPSSFKKTISLSFSSNSGLYLILLAFHSLGLIEDNPFAQENIFFFK